MGKHPPPKLTYIRNWNMFLFYCPYENLDLNSICTLGKEESHHAIQVLRIKKDDPVELTNGKGRLARGRMINPNPKACIIAITDLLPISSRNYRLHIAISPLKSIDRFEWFLEKSVELGIDEITPLVSQNSEKRNINRERALKVMIAALKQSRQAYLPILNAETRFEDFSKRDHHGLGYIAHCKEVEKLNLFSDLCKIPVHSLREIGDSPIQNIYGSSFVVCIGPEGDFTMDEIKVLQNQGFLGVSLGNSRLRTETAAILVVAQFLSIFSS